MLNTLEDTLNRPAVEALCDAKGIDGYADLARRAGMERTYLSRIMRGQRPAQPSHLIAIARALMVPPIAISFDPAAGEEV